MNCFFRSDGPCCPPYFVQDVTIQSMGVLSSGNAKLKPTNEGSDKRVPLSRERVLQAAIAVADAAGVRALTIRSLAANSVAGPGVLRDSRSTITQGWRARTRRAEIARRRITDCQSPTLVGRSISLKTTSTMPSRISLLLAK